MKIGMLLAKTFPPDIRVEKEIISLNRSNHTVYLLACLNAESKEEMEEKIKGLIIRRIPNGKNTLPIYTKIIYSVLHYLSFVDRYWYYQIERYVRDFKLELLHVHDLPLSATAISVAKKYSIPVVLDLHENYPAALQVWRTKKYNLINWLRNNLKRWKNYEKNAANEAAHIITVVNEAKERLVEEYKISSNKISVIMNVEDEGIFNNYDTDSKILSRYRGKYTVAYVGGGGEHRGLDTAIRSIAYLKNKISNLKMVIVGLNNTDKLKLEIIAKSNGITGIIDIYGWQPINKIPSFIKASDVCIVPHNKNAHTDSTIPHKLFQYMLLKKPVIVSDCTPLKRIIEETKSGIVFRSKDVIDLSKKIYTIYKDKELRVQYGNNGFNAVISKYNWTFEGQKLVELYGRLKCSG